MEQKRRMLLLFVGQKGWERHNGSWGGSLDERGGPAPPPWGRLSTRYRISTDSAVPIPYYLFPSTDLPLPIPKFSRLP